MSPADRASNLAAHAKVAATAQSILAEARTQAVNLRVSVVRSACETLRMIYNHGRRSGALSPFKMPKVG